MGATDRDVECGVDDVIVGQAGHLLEGSKVAHAAIVGVRIGRDIKVVVAIPLQTAASGKEQRFTSCQL